MSVAGLLPSALSSLASLPPLAPIGYPLASRLAVGVHTPSLTSTGEYEGEGPTATGRETIAVMMKQRIYVKPMEAMLTHPSQSTFDTTEITLPKDAEPTQVGSLPDVINVVLSAPKSTLSSLAAFQPDDVEPDAPNGDVEFAQAKLSPSGVVAGGAPNVEAAISAALAVTTSQGVAQVWVQDDAQEWNMRYNMSSYLLRGYLASGWCDLKPFDSSVGLPSKLPNIPSHRDLQQRTTKVHVTSLAWSGRFEASVAAAVPSQPLAASAAAAAAAPTAVPSIMLAMGSRAGVVSVWRFATPMQATSLPSMSLSGSSAPAGVSSAHAHPELVCAFVPPAPTHSRTTAFITSLAFSPMYFDAPRGTRVVALAVGTSDGRAHVYAIDTSGVGVEARGGAPEEPEEEKVGAGSAGGAGGEFPMQAILVTSLRAGTDLMPVRSLRWTQVTTTTLPREATDDEEHAMEQEEEEEKSPFAYQGASCQSAEEESPPQQQTLHFLAVGCIGNLQAVTLHPDLYLDTTAASILHHPAVNRVFQRNHAHAAPINSLIWSISSSATFAAGGGAATATKKLAAIHVQLLSSSDDDIVHRWILRDGAADQPGGRGGGGGVAMSGGGGIFPCDYTSSVDLMQFGSPDAAAHAPSRLAPFPLTRPLHGAHGLLRSADGLLLFSLDVHSLSTNATKDIRRRTAVALLAAQVFPTIELDDDDREEFARCTIEAAGVWTGEDLIGTGTGSGGDGKKRKKLDDAEQVVLKLELGASARKSRSSSSGGAKKTPLERMREQELEERKAEASAAAAASSGVVAMEIDEEPSVAAAASTSASAASAAAAGRPLIPVAAAKSSTGAAKRSAPAPSEKAKKKPPKKKKRRRTIGAASASDDDASEDEDEWKAEDHEEGDEDDGDASEDDDEAMESEAGSSSKKKKKAAGGGALKESASAPSEKRSSKKRQKLLAVQFAQQDGIPIPLPVQDEPLERKRMEVQTRIIRRLVASWLGRLAQAAQAQSVANPPADGVGPRPLPLAISLFTFQTHLHLLANPYLLTVSPSMTDVPTLSAMSADGTDDEDPSASEPVPFSLLWRVLPRLLPADLVVGGYSSLFRPSANLPPGAPSHIYPTEAFIMPIHRHTPFLFLSDALVVVAGEMVDNALSGRSIETLWLDAVHGDDGSTEELQRQYAFRLVLVLLRIALNARTPFLALARSDRVRAEALEAKVLRALHLQSLVRHFQSFSLALDQSSPLTDAERMAIASAIPFTANLLVADWIVGELLGVPQRQHQPQAEGDGGSSTGWRGDAEMRGSVWCESTVVPLLRMADRVYSIFPACSSESVFLRSLLLAAAPTSTSSATTKPTAAWMATLEVQRVRWPQVARERCPLCDEEVPLHSARHGTCESAHTLPRCRRTLHLLATDETLSCPTCAGSMSKLAGEQTQLCKLCWSATRENA